MLMVAVDFKTPLTYKPNNPNTSAVITGAYPVKLNCIPNSIKKLYAPPIGAVY